jgi:hypothetical protein
MLVHICLACGIDGAIHGDEDRFEYSVLSIVT